MIHSLTDMMNRNLPNRVADETACALGDLNLLINNLRDELEIVKVVQTKASATEMSDLVITKTGKLMHENV
jgi:hypothetical protein